MKNYKKIITFAVSLAMLGTTSAYASAYEDIIHTHTSDSADGDVNKDGKFNISDVVIFQRWLLSVPDTKLNDWTAADFYNDNILDVFDLCLMKQKLVLSDNEQHLVWSDESAENHLMIQNGVMSLATGNLMQTATILQMAGEITSSSFIQIPMPQLRTEF